MLSSEVIAGLTGAAIGSFATLVAPWVTERIRRKVDRQHREEFFSARFIRRMEEAASGLILVTRDALRSAETAGTAVINTGELFTFDILDVNNSDRLWEASLLSGYLHDERPEYAEWQLFEAYKRFTRDLYDFEAWLKRAQTQLTIAVDLAATRNALRHELGERLTQLRHSRDDMKRLVHDAVLAIGGEPFGAPYNPLMGESSQPSPPNETAG